MANMSYCRFRNTLQDLLDCEDNLHDELGKEEHRARKQLVEACQRIIESAGEEQEYLPPVVEGEE